MVLPLFKVLSLVLRVFSKPLITYIKKVHLKKDAGSTHPLLRKGFIYFGNQYQRFETYINRRFMKIQTQFAFKPLPDELAIEKGIQFFYEIVFYSIVIGLPLYQMVQSSNESKAKTTQLNDKLKQIQDQLIKITARQAQRAKMTQVKKRQEQQKARQILLREQEQAKVIQKPQLMFVNPAIYKLVPSYSIKLEFLDASSRAYNLFFVEQAEEIAKILDNPVTNQGTHS